MQAARQNVMMTGAETASCARTGIWRDGICDATASTKAVRS